MIIVGIGVAMAFGSVGGMETGSMNLGQGCVTGLIGAALIILSTMK